MLDPDVVDAWGMSIGNTQKILEDPANVKQHFQEREFLSDYVTAAFRKNSRYEEPEKYGGKRKTKQRNRKSRRSRTFKKKRR